jgi:hypothetical protein
MLHGKNKNLQGDTGMTKKITVLLVVAAMAIPVQAQFTQHPLSPLDIHLAICSRAWASCLRGCERKQTAEEKENCKATCASFLDGCFDGVLNEHGITSFALTVFRAAEEPTEEEAVFDVPGSQTATITLINGAAGTIHTRENVTSAWVYVNDILLFSPSDFNKQVDVLRAEVTLLPGENRLKVKLAGAPDSFCTIFIY